MLISFAVSIRKADLRLCFRICKKGFSHDAAHILYYVQIYTRNGHVISFNQNVWLNSEVSCGCVHTGPILNLDQFKSSFINELFIAQLSMFVNSCEFILVICQIACLSLFVVI